MSNNESLGQRLAAYLKENKIPQSKFAELLGTSQPVVSQMISGKREITNGMLARISKIFPDFDESSELMGNEVPDKFITYAVPMAAMGGTLIGFEDEGVRREDCERVISPIANIDWVVPVCGDSMEPEYPNGSKVYVRQINPSDFIPWGNVFVLDTTNGLIIKMVVESDKPGHVRCVSLNPSGRYAPFDVPAHAIRAMYRVMLCVAVK
ncbi:MAG: LexA family transcriptional regulator [Muribaculaceae bacterium]|nr:LexA family transcriptional regulator [Muribaculaceae bacterium]